MTKKWKAPCGSDNTNCASTPRRSRDNEGFRDGDRGVEKVEGAREVGDDGLSCSRVLYVCAGCSSVCAIVRETAPAVIVCDNTLKKVHYYTIFARKYMSVALPADKTAGLHW